MVSLSRKVNNATVNEDNDATQNITSPELVQKLAQLQKQKNDAKKRYDQEVQRLDDNIAQLMQQQAQINAQQQNQNNQQNNQNTNQQNNQQNESINYSFRNRLFEGKNTKHDLLAKAIQSSMINFSYILSNDEIKRLARKINDYLNSHKGEDDLWNSVRIDVKIYLLNHNKISLSQSEINSFLDYLEDELQKREYDVFSYLFDDKTDEIVIEFDDDTNVDELEADLADLDFDVDEDLDNNKLILTNIDSYNLRKLKSVLRSYDLLKINYDIF